MNLLSNINEINMDSREIAELTGKNHADVCRDIRNQLDQMQIGESVFASSYKSKQNKDIKCYSLDYEMTMVLISGYSIPLRAKIIKRWTELEKKYKPTLPQSFSEALQLAADQAKQLELQAPKVEFYDTVTKSNDYMTFKEVANIMAIPKMGRNSLMKQLRDKGFLTQFNKPYQRYINQKLFKLIESDKNGKIFTSTVVSQKGLDRIIKELK